MPSRQLPSLLASPPLNNTDRRRHQHHHHHHDVKLLPPVIAGALTFTILSFIILIFFFYRKLWRNRTAPSDLKSPNHCHHHQQCRRFSYSFLRRATASFSPSNRLGHGGFGLLMDLNCSLQGKREFHNELSLASSLQSPYIVSLLGFSSDRRRRKLTLVYELMENRSLQEALLDRKCEELMNWRKRFDVLSDVAKGLEYLHHFCDPPVIHGDIKPSNISLDANFNAKIGDFVLARLKTEENVVEKETYVETESVVTGDEDSHTAIGVDRSPESFAARGLDSDASPEMGVDKGTVSEAGFDKLCVYGGNDLVSGGKKCGSRRDWWWKQDNGGGSDSENGGVSSTPSMRGTVCYIAPEYGGGGLLSEKCDVYSFGVLLLVVVSGRRPLQVTASPMSEFERANLISWARQLAYNGKLLELVDPSVHSLDNDQALLCITIALLCLQRSPTKRPTMKEIVGLLSGETEPPNLPFEFSPSPPSNFPFKSRKKAR
ncbi:hypothetical protein P3X46_014686 [Hevea brasiliensis]|uniref:Protein kinase domain-containing protein n=1 Tax=Hevea brasiliensis TaxID=3981 RepID=A0ABQ9LVE6_HEVBR|nr:hypothetical protein P3X46_014686 [Hevea brasiliensis]